MEDEQPQTQQHDNPVDAIYNLCHQLRDYHDNTVQELEAKVSKLKKERCLDAQRLGLFYHCNQQLKDEVKALRETVSLLEEKLRAGVCDRCALLEDTLKNKQNQNLHIINRLKNERSSLEEDNQKVHKWSDLEAQQTSSSEQEDCIPDSPILTNSLLTTSRLKKRKNINRHVRLVETPLQQSCSSLFDEVIQEPSGATIRSGKAEVLVPNTCEMDTSQTSRDTNCIVEEEIAETCSLELPDNQCGEIKMAAHQKNSENSDWISNVRLKPYSTSTSPSLIYSPDLTTKKAQPLLLSVKRVSGGSAFHKAKRTKEESDLEVQDEGHHSVQGEAEKQKEHSAQSLKTKSAQLKIESSQSTTSSQSLKRSHLSPDFKRNKQKVGEGNEDGTERRRKSVQDVSLRWLDAEDVVLKHGVETMWSVDPAAALSMYENQSDEEKETQHRLRETVDTDSTFVSNSLLQHQERRHSASGRCEGENETFDQMFDVTAYEEYNSHLDHSPSCAGGDNDEEEDEKPGPSANTRSKSQEHKRRNPTFAHVAVIRKKEERRKLKGTTCKECETYYANLPEEEKHKKLSACSRHRFLHIPPCTPQNFWEVGFPSTQTCIERGYIKEQTRPQEQLRRRQPFAALFSSKPQQKN